MLRGLYATSQRNACMPRSDTLFCPVGVSADNQGVSQFGVS